MLLMFRIQQKGEHYLNLNDNLINVFLNLPFNYYSQNTYFPQASFIFYDFIVKLSKYLWINLINIYCAPNIFLKGCASLVWRYKMATISFILDYGSSKHNNCTYDSKAKRKEKIIKIKLINSGRQSIGRFTPMMLLKPLGLLPELEWKEYGAMC